MLKLHSADSSVGHVRIDHNNIESYFNFSQDASESQVEMLIEALERKIVDWGNKSVKLLKKSKTPQAIALVEEYEELYDEFSDDMQAEECEVQAYCVVKMNSGNFYTVSETVEEIDELLRDIEYNEKYGISQ